MAPLPPAQEGSARGSDSPKGEETSSGALVPAPGKYEAGWSALGAKEPNGEDLARAWVRTRSAAVRGLAIGLVLRGGLSALKAIMAAARAKRKAAIAAVPAPSSEIVNTLRWGGFIGGLGGTFVGVDEVISIVFGKERTSRFRSLLSGFVAGQSLWFLGTRPSDRQNALAIYVFLRAMWLGLRRARQSATSPLLRRLSLPSQMAHADVAVMCLSCSQILYSWLLMPKTLSKTYEKFLDRHCGKPAWTINVMRHMILANDLKKKVGQGGGAAAKAMTRRLPRASGGTKRLGLGDWKDLVPAKDLPRVEHKTTPRGVVLQGQSELGHHLGFFLKEYPRKIPVYLPVYFIPALLVHRQKLIRPGYGPTVLRKCVAGTMRSSLFLTGFCTMAWVCTVTSTRLTVALLGKHKLNGLWTAVMLSPVGLSLLLEKQSRRKEIAAYCAARAMESFLLCSIKWGWIPKRAQFKRFDVFLFSLGVALIVHCYSDSHGKYRNVLAKKYLNVLDFVFGNTGIETQEIRHVPSTGEIAGMVVAKIKRTCSLPLLQLAEEGPGAKHERTTSVSSVSEAESEVEG